MSNNRYIPRGWNDNNMCRSNVPSNLAPYESQYNGNPLSTFDPITTNTQLGGMQYGSRSQISRQQDSQQNGNNFNMAYQQNQPMIERIDYSNKNNLIHNNIADPVFAEDIIEYRINIDSLDRDICKYPNPFDFEVSFDESTGNNVRTETIKNGQCIAITEWFKGACMPLINKRFRNIKYIKLDSIVLPQFHAVKKSEEEEEEETEEEEEVECECECEGDCDCGCKVETPCICIENTDQQAEYEVDKEDPLSSDRFIILAIDEINESDRVYSTSDSGMRINPETGKMIKTIQPFSLIYPNRYHGTTFYDGIPFNGHRFYKHGNLGNLRKLGIKFYDSCGNPLKVENQFTGKYVLEREEAGCPVPLTDVRHPLNKKFQLHLSFVIGVVESQITTKNKFER